MKNAVCRRWTVAWLVPLLCHFLCVSNVATVSADDLLTIQSEHVKVGIARNRGGAITWLSSQAYPKNMINLADPGRLIQQSYYAGRSIDRTSEGQSKSWSPWSWNPIQGGGVGGADRKGTWARVPVFERTPDTLHSETVPKLWDMPDEDADAIMRQWTSLEPEMEGVVRVRCEFSARRNESDRWGPTTLSPQEVPACYFTRNFDFVRSYLGDGKWRTEHQQPGPPWGTAIPPRKAMALFEPSGQGVAVFAPAATEHWNFGPHAHGNSDDPHAGPCMHAAPIDRVPMGPQSTYRYRYWLIVGNEEEITSRLNVLWQKYSQEKAQIHPAKQAVP